MEPIKNKITRQDYLDRVFERTPENSTKVSQWAECKDCIDTVTNDKSYSIKLIDYHTHFIQVLYSYTRNIDDYTDEVTYYAVVFIKE